MERSKILGSASMDPSNVGAKLWDDFRNLVYDHIDEKFNAWPVREKE